MTGLTGQGRQFAVEYFRMLSFALPFLTTMFVANACLRGAGDTLTPAVTFIIVDIVNMLFSFGLCYGLWGLPAWGFDGIAAGTVIAYIIGGVIQIIVLLHGRGGIRLHIHRLAPHWHNLKRLLRIGLPAGFADAIQWIANFAMVIVINQMDKTLVSSARTTTRSRSRASVTSLALPSRLRRRPWSARAWGCAIHIARRAVPIWPISAAEG